VRPRFHAAFRRSLFAALREALVAAKRAVGFGHFGTSSFCSSIDRASASIERRPSAHAAFPHRKLSATLAGRAQFQVRGRFASLRVKLVACLEIILVGKWRPNDSFKPKPLRGSA